MLHYQGKGSLFYQTQAAFYKGSCLIKIAVGANLLTVGIGTALMSQVFLVSVGNTASTDTAKPRAIPQQREAWMDASDYSVVHPGVAFVVYGRTPDATNNQIVEFIKARFTEKGVVSTSFTVREKEIGASFGFYLNGDAYGPVGLNKMMATIDEVAGHAHGLQTLQSGQKR